MVRDIQKMFFLPAVRSRQWRSEQSLRSLQDRLLADLVEFSVKNVPYYERIFREQGLVPADVRKVDDLGKLPLLSKAGLKQAFESKQIFNKSYSGASIVRTTSGSSGFPLSVAYDSRSYAWVEAVYARALLEQGVRIRDRIAYFWFEPFENRGFWERLGLFRKNEILYTDDEENQIRSLLKLRPTVIHAFPSVLTSLSEKAPDFARNLPLRLIITHGETLTREARDKIEKAFKVRVLDQYGTNEFVRMAWECPEEGNYHIDADSLIMEFLDEEMRPVSPGESGRIVVTGLINRLMPLIRYDIGDVGIPLAGRCPCGRSLPLLQSVQGRSDDFIISSRGDLISPRRIGGILEGVGRLRQYRFIQEDINRYCLKIIPADGYGEEDRKIIRERIIRVLGPDVDLSLEEVSWIEKGKTGKVKAIHSKLSKDMNPGKGSETGGRG